MNAVPRGERTPLLPRIEGSARDLSSPGDAVAGAVEGGTPVEESPPEAEVEVISLMVILIGSLRMVLINTSLRSRVKVVMKPWPMLMELEDLKVLDDPARVPSPVGAMDGGARSTDEAPGFMVKPELPAEDEEGLTGSAAHDAVS